MVTLNLSYNLLTNMPDGVSGTTNDYNTIDLSHNMLVTTSCTFEPAFTQVKYLYLNDNMIGAGCDAFVVPDSIWTNSKADTLDLSKNQISAKLPSVATLYLKVIRLANNRFFGQVPSIFNATDVDLSHNNFTGGIGNLSSVFNTLDISYNNFNGSLRSLNASTFRASHNNFLNWPSDSVYPRATTFDISWNNIGGTFSPGKLSSQIQYLNLGHNHFEGVPNMTDFSKLVFLDVSNNNFSGVVLGSSPAITELYAQNNLFTDIPPGMFGPNRGMSLTPSLPFFLIPRFISPY